MKNHKSIYEILESWGKGKRELPPNNEVLKNEVLSKASQYLGDSGVPVRLSSTRNPYAWLSFSLTALAVLVFTVNLTGYTGMGILGNKIGNPTSINGTTRGAMPTLENQGKLDTYDTSSYEEAASAPSGSPSLGYAPAANSERSILPSQPYDGRREVPLTDTREFLKESYNATLQTRHVTDLETRIEILVRGLGGRVDYSSASEKNGYISFAVPKDRLDAFKIGVKDLVGKKFYIEQISSENLLPQKQVIEESKTITEGNLSSLKAERARLIKNHNLTIAAYQNNIESMRATMAALNYEYQSATYGRRTEIENKLRELAASVNGVELEISRENKNYSSRLGGIDRDIKYAGENLKMIQKADANLLESVATVNGSISLHWISLWEMADAYAPGPLAAWILILAAMISYFMYRRTSNTLFEV